MSFNFKTTLDKKTSETVFCENITKLNELWSRYCFSLNNGSGENYPSLVWQEKQTGDKFVSFPIGLQISISTKGES